MILLLVLSAGCQTDTKHVPNPNQNQLILTPTIASVSSPTVKNSIEVQVPYSKTSVWNTPIGPSPKYDVHSAEMIANLVHSNEGRIITAGPDFNYPVYFADEQTPRWDITCTINECTIASSDQDIIRTDLVRNIPIPTDAQPGDDTDGRMIIIDTVTRTGVSILSCLAKINYGPPRSASKFHCGSACFGKLS